MDFIYDNENRPTSLRYNGTVNRTDYVYDALGRISSRNAVLNNAPCLSSYGCTAGASLPLTHCFTIMPFLIAPETPCYNTPVMPEGTEASARGAGESEEAVQ